MQKRKIIWSGVLWAVCVAALGVGLLVDSAAVGQGIRDGLAVCGNVLIPSLFPFMALAGFVSRTGYADILALPLSPVTTKLYKLPAECGAVVLLSLVGGFPVGARMTANLLEQKRISRETAQRMLCFCVNSGPSFLISAVGAGMLMSKRAGVILLVTQTLSTLIVGTVVSRNAEIPAPADGGTRKPGGAGAFVEAVSGASSSMLIMCAFAVLFSGLLALLQSSGLLPWLADALALPAAVVTAAAGGLFEVTAGCLAGARVGGIGGFALISASVSFCGLSVICQVMSCFQGQQMRFGQFFRCRLAHIVCALALALPLYRMFCGDQNVWLPTDPPLMRADERTWVISICLLAMCSILVLSTVRRRKKS